MKTAFTEATHHPERAPEGGFIWINENEWIANTAILSTRLGVKRDTINHFFREHGITTQSIAGRPDILRIIGNPRGWKLHHHWTLSRSTIEKDFQNLRYLNRAERVPRRALRINPPERREDVEGGFNQVFGEFPEDLDPWDFD
jgi:hypothetical protein